MSYSFTLQAATKAAVLAAVASKLDGIAAQQQCHTRDLDHALAAATAFVGLLDDEESKHVVVIMSGSMNGVWAGGDVTEIAAAAVSISASHAPPPVGV